MNLNETMVHRCTCVCVCVCEGIFWGEVWEDVAREMGNICIRAMRREWARGRDMLMMMRGFVLTMTMMMMMRAWIVVVAFDRVIGLYFCAMSGLEKGAGEGGRESLEWKDYVSGRFLE